MPRRGRRKSGTDIYHVMLRGINRQVIFEDDEDCAKMLQTLSDVKDISKCRIFAYCLMQNHCHFVVKTESESLGQIFKRLGARYVYWYNLKYKRTGHLFQDRYKSETIEDDKRLLAVLRYVHQNPINAGLTKALDDYMWSSYREYTGKPRLVDTEYIFKMISKKDFEEYSISESSEKAMEDEQRANRISDTEAKERILEISGSSNLAAYQQLPPGEQRMHLKKFKESGMSIRQINRMTGISKGIVERA